MPQSRQRKVAMSRNLSQGPRGTPRPKTSSGNSFLKPHTRQPANTTTYCRTMQSLQPDGSCLDHEKDTMCWLCGRESDIVCYLHSMNPRMGIYRLVTIAKNRDTPGLNGPVEVSEVHARPPLTRRPTKNDINKRAVTLSTQEGTNATQIHDDSTSTWTLRVHADCWEMVSCRVADPGAFAAKWTDALISLNEEFFSTGKGPKIPRLILSPTTIAAGTKNYRRQGHQRLETFDGLALELGLKSLPASTSPMGLDQLEAGFYARDHLSLPTINSNDPFSKLPKEIRESIIAYAATKDLPNLRLASRQIAIISCLSALKMSFWLSRFLPAFEMGFALPEIYDPELDFRALYFLIIRACDKPLVPGNEGEGNLVKRLTKRRYWWNSLSAVVAL